MGAMLHDIGKIGIADSILKKPGKLSSEEWVVVKQHPVIGAEPCRPLRDSGELVPIVRHHHERLDGSGYPDGLRGDEIPLGAQVVAIADLCDTCTCNRPYRPAMSPEQVAALLQAMARKGQMDGPLVAAFIDIVWFPRDAGAGRPAQGQS